MKQACNTIIDVGADYLKAKDLYDAGHYCEGLSAIDEAVKKAPSDKDYSDLKRRLQDSCIFSILGDRPPVSVNPR